MLMSLDASACTVNINRLFHSLLQNRKVTLLTPQGRATKDQKQGWPQGSCSGPSLWNLVSNEILNHVWPDNVHIQAFADDFVLVIEADTNLVSKSNIQNKEETFFDSKAIPTPYIGSLSQHPNGSVTNYTRHPTPTHAITFRSQVYINLSPKNPSSSIITDTQPQDLEIKATGWSTHSSEHLKPNQISFEDGEAYIARKDIKIFSQMARKTNAELELPSASRPMTSGPTSGLLNSTTTTLYFKLNSLHFMKH
ncbi:hypothetical protein AVEN_148565-1 [Araneus ventricosus]|uniref:Reverse transcriptase domain-containing protein n=1 Tax=Araneus ventricosus TaxID=182803 RepID=A0A4Y2R422_ARAVE|nr:hypothetical protein AVEN_148565-1 [Araneus ventricosus]